MQVIHFQGRCYSLSNRRLCLYRLCQHVDLEAPVKVQLNEQLPTDFRRKFTSQCEGDWVRVRKDGRICGRTFEDMTFGREELFAM